MVRMLRTLVRDDAGQDIIEYALLAAGIAVFLIPFIGVLGTAISDLFGRIGARVGNLP